jgi:hypothetical protein
VALTVFEKHAVMRRAALALPMIPALASAVEAGSPRKCHAESERLFGKRAVVVDKKIVAPRKVHNVPVDFSGMGESRTGSGMWMGEALIAGDGTIARAWTIRSPRFEPAWSEFDEIVAGTLKQWRYEPLVIDGVATPLCMVVTMNIHWS